MGEKRNVYRALMGKPEGKRPLGRPRHRWVDNIKLALRERERERGWGGTDWIDLMIIIFWEMTPCGSYKNRRFGGSYRLHLQGARV
jgi:hypothetical protein